MKKIISAALVVISVGLASAEDVCLESMNMKAVQAAGAAELPVPAAAMQAGENGTAPCALFVGSLQAVNGNERRSIGFFLETNTPGDPVIEAGYTFINGGSGLSGWEYRKASASGSNAWVVDIYIPATFNYSYADLAFYAKTAHGHTYWLNKDSVSGRNFRIDVPLFYMLEGYAQELAGKDISTLHGPELVRQFNPLRCGQQ